MMDAILLATGVIVGAMNAVAGGGMLLGFPVLLAAGLPALNASATTNLVVLPGQLSSAYGYRDLLKRTPKRYLLLAVPCLLGAAIGSTLLRHTPAHNFQHFIPGLIIFAVALFTFQPFLHDHVLRHLRTPKQYRNRIKPLAVIAATTLPLAIYGGYFGAGFGFIMLAFLGFTRLHEMHQMNALKNLMAVCVATMSLACLFSSSLINWQHGVFMAAGTLVGGYAGARLAQKVPSHAMRIVVIIIGIGTAAYLGLRKY